MTFRVLDPGGQLLAQGEALRLASLDEERSRLIRARKLLDEAALTLRTFYESPITMSALQPVLDLAVQLNPDLRVQR